MGLYAPDAAGQTACAVSAAFAKEKFSVRSFGNSLTSAGELRGMVPHEFSQEVFAYHDERFVREICAQAHRLR